MRRVLIVEKPNETYSYAAVDHQTGEVLLRLRDRERRAAAQAAELSLREEKNLLEARARELDLEVARRLDTEKRQAV